MRNKTVYLILIAAFLLVLVAPAIDALASGDQPAGEKGEYVRLRGSVEIHVPDCPKVQRADEGGVVKAHRNDGPPCFICLRNKAGR